MRRLLLLSSSRVAGDTGYLDAYADMIRDFLGAGCRAGAFVPWAGVTVSHDDYTAKARERFAALGYALEGAHAVGDPLAALRACDAVVVGGGNTFQLLHDLHATGALGLIRARVLAGLPYVGWSAGSNVACPTLGTTNDMPIVQPVVFSALGLVPFQLNPHYNNALPAGHQGETRDQRLAEYLVANPAATVVGLREGSALRIEGTRLSLLGPHPLKVFRQGQDAVEREPGDLSDLLD
jgi:dipeptidase E